MLGYAATVKIRGSAPPTAAGPYPDRTDWWDYILSLPAPRVVVVQDVATQVGLGSLLGAVHVNILRALGCVGAVTNGSVRDLPAAEKLGFHLFAGSISVSHAYVHIVEFGTPVEIGGLKIQSGDLLHGDLHGVQSIPLDSRRQDSAGGGGNHRPGTGIDHALPVKGFLGRKIARRRRQRSSLKSFSSSCRALPSGIHI